MHKNNAGPFSPWDIAVALALLTRLPLPRLPDTAFARQAGAAWAYPLVGVVVAGMAAAMGGLAMWLGLPATLAAGLVLGTQIALTGAMHEDGLGDSVDGLWGGSTPERRLEIMRDSQTGTFGTLALILSVGLRWMALAILMGMGAGMGTGMGTGMGALMAAAAVSRAVLPGMMRALPHARGDGLSHGVGVPGRGPSIVSLALGIGLAVIAAGPGVLVPVGLGMATVAGLATVAHARIGGQTGDILGAAQQIMEIAILLGLVALTAG